MRNDQTILCVDDEPNILDALERVFFDEDWLVLTASSPDEAMELLEEEPVALVLSDYRMPSKNGVAFLKEVKDRYPDTIRIVLSGYADINVVIAALNEGEIYRFMAKPWNDEELLDVVRKGLAHRELMLENRRLAEELQALNEGLQQRVEERTEELTLRNQVLTFAQEVLEHLPLGVFGITCEGWIALANEHAGRVFGLEGQPLIGELAREVFPAALTDLLEATMTAGQTQRRVWIAEQGTALDLTCVPLGQPELRGLILTGRAT